MEEELIVIHNPGWHEFALVTLKCSLVGNLLAAVAIGAIVNHKGGFAKRKVDIVPLLLLSVIIDLVHSAFVLWYYNSVPERIEFDEYDRPTNLVYSSLNECTAILNYLGQIWKVVAALEVSLALHRFLTIVCRVKCPAWTILLMTGVLTLAMLATMVSMHVFGEVYRSRFWCSYRYSEESGKEVLDFIHSLCLIGAIILHTTTLAYQIAMSKLSSSSRPSTPSTPPSYSSSSIGLTLCLLLVLPLAAVDAVVWQFGLHEYSYLFKFLPDNYHFHLAEYRLLLLSISTILFVEEVRSTLLSVPLSLFHKTKSRFVHAQRPKVPRAVDV